MRRKILVIFGTRPEIIKLAPVIEELRKFSDIFNIKTIATAQHREMLDQILAVFKITPNIDLDLMQPDQKLPDLTARSAVALAEVFENEQPDYILVQGDTTTAMIAGLIGFYYRIPVGHVEAGLRTRDCYSPFPEEMNRRLIGALAYHHFAPTEKAKSALLREGVSEDSIFVTGNTVVDTLLKVTKISLNLDFPFLNNENRLILVTAHRRENWNERLESICRALIRIIEEFKDVDVIYPVHLNPNVRQTVFPMLDSKERVWLIEPVDYPTFVHLMKRCYLILTDSGGVQEEAPSLGKPVLIMRNDTERPEAIEVGIAKLVGTDEDRIVKETLELLSNPESYGKMARVINPYGDGKAAERIVNVLIKNLLI